MIRTIFLFCPLLVFALPTGVEVVHGEVRFDTKQNQMRIHASDGSIVHYQSFDLARHEKIEFIQPNRSARILNRIQSNSPSSINGHIRANGQVYLLNSAGLVFGPNAHIETGRLFAIAASMRNEDFLRQENRFFDLVGDLVNQGNLIADEVHLVGKKVQNLGRITGDVVTLLSGNEVMVGEKNGHCFVVVDSEPREEIGSCDLIGLAIQNQGALVAKQVHLEGDSVQVEGAITADSVKILGNDIVLQSLQIEAERGTVLIGGDFQGQGELRKAQTVVVAPDALIDVSAKEKGDGGKVIIWSDGTTLFNGQIVARGGSEEGNGGFIETSGKLGLGCQVGRVDASALNGKAGEWLLDPTTLTIMAGGAATLAQAANCGLALPLVIDPATIHAAGADVTLCATVSITHAPMSSIDIPGHGITYTAPSTILAGDTQITTHGGFIMFNSPVSGAFDLHLSPGTGLVTFTDPVNISSITTDPTNYDIIFLAGGSLTTPFGTNFLNQGNVTFGGPTFPTFNFTLSPVSTASGPSKTIVQGTVNVTGSLTFGQTEFETGNSLLSTTNETITLGNVNLVGNANASLDSNMFAGNTITVGNVTGAAGTLQTQSGGAFSTTIASLNILDFVPSNSQFVTVTGNTTLNTADLTGMAPNQTVTFNGLVDITSAINTVPLGYTVIFNAGGTISASAPPTNFFNSFVQFGNSSSSNLVFTNGVNTNFPNVNTSTFGVVQTSAVNMTLGPLTLLGGTLLQSLGQQINFDGTINGSQSLTANASGGSVTFNGTVGNTFPPTLLDVIASSIAINTSSMETQGEMLFNGPVTLGVDTVLTDIGSVGIAFLDTIDGAYHLTLDANANVSVAGVVGGTTPLLGLSVNAGGTTTLASDCITSGTAGLNAGNITVVSGGSVFSGGTLEAIGGAGGFSGGAVSLMSTNGSVTVNNIDVSGGTGGAGGNAGSITLQPSTSFFSSKLGNVPQGTLEIQGTLTALGSMTGMDGNVFLAPAARTQLMSVATIFGNPAGSDLTIRAGNLTVGPEEALTVIGNLLFDLSSSASLGDVVALNNLTINTPQLNVLAHQPSQILNFLGLLSPNRGVHFISKDTVVNAASITQVGSGPQARFLSDPALAKQLLFYKQIVLNFDGEIVPLSGIVDWVLPADTTWDTVPLVPYRRTELQNIFCRIDAMIQCQPCLERLWQRVQKWNDCNPVAIAFEQYSSGCVARQRINMLEFSHFLQRQSDAKKYIAMVRDLLNMGERRNCMKGSKQQAPALYYFQQDVIEFTCPYQLTSDQWSALLH